MPCTKYAYAWSISEKAFIDGVRKQETLQRAFVGPSVNYDNAAAQDPQEHTHTA